MDWQTYYKHHSNTKYKHVQFYILQNSNVNNLCKTRYNSTLNPEYVCRRPWKPNNDSMRRNGFFCCLGKSYNYRCWIGSTIDIYVVLLFFMYCFFLFYQKFVYLRFLLSWCWQLFSRKCGLLHNNMHTKLERHDMVEMYQSILENCGWPLWKLVSNNRCHFCYSL